MVRLVAMLTITGLLVVSAVRADDKPKGGKEKAKGKVDAEAVFKRLDANEDGKLSKEEFAKFGEQAREKLKEKGKAKNADGRMSEAIFKRLDANNDGYLTLEEFKKIGEMRQQQKKKDK